MNRKFYIVTLFALAGVWGCRTNEIDERLRKALESFQLEDGMRIELVVSEPLVIDPVAFAFDEDKRLYVVEDRGYPDPAEGGTPTTLGRVALLVDSDGDGRYDQRHDFATDLTYPNGILPWKGGVFVTCAPHIYYFKDTDGDGKADIKKIVLTGFNDTKTSQIRMSHPTLGPDGWIYVTGGLNGGSITSPDHPDRAPVTYTSADGRFHPETLEFQVTGGKSQFGLTIDPYGRRFGTSNRHPVMQAVMEPWHLSRNPDLLFNEAIEYVSPVEAEAVVYPISKAVTTADYIPKLIGRSHAGTFTAASGLVMFYGAGLLPEHRGNVFICESAQNLVQRQVVEAHGPSFRSEIAEPHKEFVASTDEWFRPVFAQHGPGGGLYIADMYRKVIDHPSYIPEEMRDKLDFESGKTDGRIYRVIHESFDRSYRDAVGDVGSGAGASQLVQALSSPDEWTQATAFRLLLEEQPKEAVDPLKDMLLRGALPESRARSFWLLRLFGELDADTWRQLFTDSVAAVREQAVQLSSSGEMSYPELIPALIAAADDESPRVRYLAALALGDVASPDAVAALANIAARDGANKWTRAAVLSGIGTRTSAFLETFRAHESVDASAFAAVMQDLGRLLGHGGTASESRAFLKQLVSTDQIEEWNVSAALGLAEGLGGTLYSIGGPAGRSDVERFIHGIKTLVVAPETTHRSRLRAIALLGFTDYQQSHGILRSLLDAQYPPDVQLEAVSAISRLQDPRGAMLLTEKDKWSAYSPNVKPAVISALVSNRKFLPVLFSAIENGTVTAAEISSVDRVRLMKSEDATIRDKADKLFGELEGGDRMAVYQEYRNILNKSADAKAGAAVFQTHCGVCHSYAGKGGQVGPDLTGVKNQPPDALLLHILVPNYEVYPAYQSIVVRTNDGGAFSGWVVSETENSLTLRTAFGTDEAILRSNIKSLTNSGLSLMPDGLEQTMNKEDMADLIAYLREGDEK